MKKVGQQTLDHFLARKLPCRIYDYNVFLITLKLNIVRCLIALQKQACMAIRNLVARTRDYSAAVLQLGAEELINNALSVSSCEDEAKAALRDLGCQVDLKIRWTGEKGSLPQTAY